MCVLLESRPLSVALKSQSGASTGFEFWQYEGSDKFQGYVWRLSEQLNLCSHPIMVGSKSALKHFISKLILAEKTLKGTKTVFFKIYVTTKFQNFWTWVWRSTQWHIELCATVLWKFARVTTRQCIVEFRFTCDWLFIK